MKKHQRLFWITFFLLITVWPVFSAHSQPQGAEDGILVGRIAHVTGKLLRYVPEEKDWVVTVKDAPFGLNDALYSEREGKAEFLMPNSTIVRIAGDTQVQLISLKPEVTEIDVASGMVRFYNNSPQGIIKVTTPFGFVFAPGGTIFDLYVGDESIEVIALKGNVNFVLDSDQTRYEVIAGQGSILADRTRVVSGEGNVDADWDDWNAGRDSIWAKRARVRGESIKYLPPPLEDEAYVLEENGRWEKVYYEGGYYEFWRPIYVETGWRPYTAGRWSVYYGDNCWIPEEPFGYVTHHYGSWVYANNLWYWAPPLVSVRVSAGPLIGIGYGWYPGRVGWISSGPEIGWFPLLWSEPYYCHRHWGHHSTVINNINITSINVNIGRYAYARQAVALHADHIYMYNNYMGHIKHLDQRTISNFRGAPVIDNRIINNFDRNPNRFHQTNMVADTKPHRDVMNRIERNQIVAKQARTVDSEAIWQDVRRVRQAMPSREDRIQVQRPRLSNKLVNPSDAGKPASEVKFDRREIKARTRPAQESTATRIQSQQAGKTGREVMPLAPGQISPSSDRDKRVALPRKPGQEIRTDTHLQSQQSLERGGRGVQPRQGREAKTSEPTHVSPVREQQETAAPVPKFPQEAQPAIPQQIRQPSDWRRRAVQPVPGQDVRSAEPERTKSMGTDRQLRRKPEEMVPKESQGQPPQQQREQERRQIQEQQMQQRGQQAPPQQIPKQIKQPPQQQREQERRQIQEQQMQQRGQQAPLQQIPKQIKQPPQQQREQERRQIQEQQMQQSGQQASPQQPPQQPQQQMQHQ